MASVRISIAFEDQDLVIVDDKFSLSMLPSLLMTVAGSCEVIERAMNSRGDEFRGLDGDGI